MIDLLEEGFDLAIRSTIPPDSSLIVRQLVGWRHVLCCTPTYLKEPSRTPQAGRSGEPAGPPHQGSRRYKADPSGVRAMCAFLTLREKVIKPLLAGVVRPFRRAPKVLAPVDQHYIRLREELNRTFETIGLAPA